MPFQYSWYDKDHTIMYINVSGDLAWDEWYQQLDNVYAELDAVSHRVDVIFHDTAPLPDSNPMPHFRNIIKNFETYRHLVRVVIINSSQDSQFAKVVVNVVSQVTRATSGKYSVFAHTVEEALDFIETDRQI